MAAIIFRWIAATGIFKAFGSLLSHIPAYDSAKVKAESLRRKDIKDSEEAIRRANYNAAVDFKIHHGDRK